MIEMPFSFVLKIVFTGKVVVQMIEKCHVVLSSINLLNNHKKQKFIQFVRDTMVNVLYKNDFVLF